MKKMIYSLVILMFLISFFALSASAKSADSTKVKKVTTPDYHKKVIKKKYDTAPDYSKPDFIIKNIVLAPGCKIKFTVKNVHKKSISEKYFQVGKVRIKIGSSTVATLRFSQIDPGKNLKNPMGRVIYTSAIILEETDSVTVTVDPGNKIPESNEINNSSSQKRLVPDC